MIRSILARVMAASVAAILAFTASNAQAGQIVLNIPTPPPGFANTYLIDVGHGYLNGVDGSAKYEWAWNIPILGPDGFTGEFITYGWDDYYGTGCSGQNCSNSVEAYGQRIVTALGWKEGAQYIVRVTNHVSKPSFDVCATVGDDVFPCARTFYQPQFRVYGDDWGTPTQTSVTLLSSTAVPEPATWAMLIAGFGLAGAGLRKSRGQRRAPLQLQQAS